MARVAEPEIAALIQSMLDGQPLDPERGIVPRAHPPARLQDHPSAAAAAHPQPADVTGRAMTAEQPCDRPAACPLALDVENDHPGVTARGPDLAARGLVEHPLQRVRARLDLRQQ